MAERKKRSFHRLSERMVRNEDIFCSLLFDHGNRTIRVVDFRGGNFQTKHSYLERVLLADGMRKIFTLIERDDMTGWHRVGYLREGTIPGYYKRSDAYIMSRIYDEDWDGAAESEDLPERKAFIADVKNLGKDLAELKGSGLKTELVAEEEVVGILKAEAARMTEKAKKSAKGKKTKGAARTKVIVPPIEDPIFQQFSRETDIHYFLCQNRRTKQANLIGAEYQDCFGNAKVDLFFSPNTKSELSIARHGLMTFIDWLGEIGAVAIFALVRADDLEHNALYHSAGFRNTGWLHRQMLTKSGPVDKILWTRKLT